MNRTEFIQQYLNKGFSLISLANNDKKPCVSWKKYQYKRASFEDILNWYCVFKEPNIAIVTGKISRLVVLDIDDPSKLPELFKLLPEAIITTRVKTKKGYHIYFRDNGDEIKSTNNFLKLGIELKANGRYVVACPSVIDNFKYSFEIPLSKMLPFPIIAKAVEPIPKKVSGIRLTYRSNRIACISQIIDRDLQEGERTNSLFILYNLLLQNRNSETYSKKLVTEKNYSLTEPLKEKEVENIFKKGYNFKCSSIMEKLPYVNCEGCKFKYSGGKFKMSNIIIHNERKLSELNGSEAKVLLFLGTVFDGEIPLQCEIIKVSGLSKNTVSNAMKGLKEKGII